jgi:GNAT superfamily N-acetyltransferase
MRSLLVRVWEFTAQPDREDAFREAYGPDGVWGSLFREAPGFEGVELLESLTPPKRFLTLDRWRDASAWEAFLHARQREYLELDTECGALVAAERDLGILRTARIGDAAAIASLAGELGYPNSAEAIRTRLAIVGAREDELVLVAEAAGGDVVGWMHVFGAVRLESEPYAEIGGLIVASPARSSGIGHALLASAETWARDRGYHDMRVRSNVVRERAHRFYERCGYSSPKSQRVFVKPLPGAHGL